MAVDMKRMHHLLILLVMYLLANDTIVAQWERVNVPLIDMPVSTTSIIMKGDSLLVGTYRGTIYGSIDGGQTWTKHNIGLSPSLYSTYSLLNVKDTVYAATTDGAYISNDWGLHWVLRNKGLPPLFSVGITSIANSNKVIFAVTPDDGVYKYQPSSDMWLPDNIGIPRQNNVAIPITSLLAKDSLIFAGTRFGIYRKKIREDDWHLISSANKSYVIGADSNKIFASIEECNASLYMTTDYGDHWQNLTSNLPKNNSTGCYFPVYSVGVKSNETVVATGDGIYVSADGGKNWRPFNTGLDGDSNRSPDKIIVTNNAFYDATHNGLYKLQMGDSTWIPVFTYFTKIPSTLKCFSLGNDLLIKSSNDYYNGTVTRTYISLNNSGSWVEDSSNTRSKLYNFFYLNNKIFGIGSNTYISYDNGSTWAESGSGLPGFASINSIVEGENFLYAGFGEYWLNADVGGIYRSNDGGKSWDLVGLENIPIQSIAIARGSVLAQSKGVYLGYSLYKSFNNGTTWNLFDSFLPNGIYPHKLGSVNDALFLGTNAGVYESDDAGYTWQLNSNGIIKGSLKPYPAVDYLYTNFQNNKLSNFIFTKVQNHIYILRQGDTMWHEVGANISRNVQSIFNLTSDSDYLYAATDSGLWRINLSAITTVDDRKEQKFPSEFNLLQNYPNPFNPTTTIKYNIPQESFVHLKVYDVIGREVALLVNEEKLPGNYEVKFDASGLASGVYFYTLSTGSYTQTKKLVLMK